MIFFFNTQVQTWFSSMMNREQCPVCVGVCTVKQARFKRLQIFEWESKKVIWKQTFAPAQFVAKHLGFTEDTRKRY